MIYGLLGFILGACALWAAIWFIYALGYQRGWRDRAMGRPYWNGAAEPPDGPGGMRQ